MGKRTVKLSDLSALSDLAPELAEMLVSVASDIVLVLDENGVIQNVALGGGEPMTVTAGDWVGRNLMEIATNETRQKIGDLLRDVAESGLSRQRHINHPSPFGLDIPIAYTAVKLGEKGPVLAVGRDMRTIAAIQNRLVQSQQEMEREHWQRRQTETRYRFLFQIGADPVLVVDGETFKIVDANRAASKLLSQSSDSLVCKFAVDQFDRDSHGVLGESLAAVQIQGRAAELEVRLRGAIDTIRALITPFRSEGSTLLLLRLRTAPPDDDALDANARFASLFNHTPDAIVMTDLSGQIQLANRAFLRLAHMSKDRTVRGRRLDEWLGDQSGEVAALLSRVQRDGHADPTIMALRTETGYTTIVELSAARSQLDGNLTGVGFIIRAARDSDMNDPAVHMHLVGPVH